jgi:RHS repeat-associated protein
MLVPGRHGEDASANYRYGFNGKEMDDEVKGEGNSYDYGARMYDPRIGRWSKPDPKEIKYPSYSPYNYALNNPIYYLDPDGRDILPSPAFIKSKYGSIYNNLISQSPTFNKIIEPYKNNKTLDLIFDINHAKATSLPNSFAVTFSPQRSWMTYSSGPKKGKMMPGTLKYLTDTSEFYSNNLLDPRVQNRVNGDGVVVQQRTYTYSDLFIACAVIHESIHALVDYNERNLTKDTGDESHSKLNDHRALLIQALTEYVQKNGLTYTSQDIEDITWNGTEKSQQFSQHFEEVAKTNGTTKEEEISKWKERNSKLSFTYDEWKPVENTGDNQNTQTNEPKK